MLLDIFWKEQIRKCIILESRVSSFWCWIDYFYEHNLALQLLSSCVGSASKSSFSFRKSTSVPHWTWVKVESRIRTSHHYALECAVPIRNSCGKGTGSLIETINHDPQISNLKPSRTCSHAKPANVVAQFRIITHANKGETLNSTFPHARCQNAGARMFLCRCAQVTMAPNAQTLECARAVTSSYTQTHMFTIIMSAWLNDSCSHLPKSLDSFSPPASLRNAENPHSIVALIIYYSTTFSWDA